MFTREKISSFLKIIASKLKSLFFKKSILRCEALLMRKAVCHLSLNSYKMHICYSSQKEIIYSYIVWFVSKHQSLPMYHGKSHWNSTKHYFRQGLLVTKVYWNSGSDYLKLQKMKTYLASIWEYSLYSLCIIKIQVIIIEYWMS